MTYLVRYHTVVPVYEGRDVLCTHRSVSRVRTGYTGMSGQCPDATCGTGPVGHPYLYSRLQYTGVATRYHDPVVVDVGVHVYVACMV